MKKIILILSLVMVAQCNIRASQFLYNIIKEVNSRPVSWKAGINSRWEGMTMDEIRMMMGSLPEPDEIKLPPMVHSNIMSDLPTEFDSRTAWPNCDSIQEIRDQSNCGSCWAFGAAEAMSDRICIHSNQIRQDRISAQDLVSCCPTLTCGYGCNGGFPSGAWSWFKQTGVVTGYLYEDTKWCYPYAMAPCDHHTTGQYEPCTGEKATPKCNQSCSEQYPGSYTTDKRHGKSAYSVSGEMNIMQEILTNGPIEVSFTVYEDFLTYKTGVYRHTTGSSLGGHAVKMIGWGQEAGIPYWLVANSWNTDWGFGGFFKIYRGDNECGIESGGAAGIPEV